MKKINVGCGPNGHPEWINIEYGILAILHRFSLIEKLIYALKLWPRGYDMKFPPNLLIHDCRRRLPFSANSIDYIYTSHFLEHLELHEANNFLRNCYKCLKKEGILRIVVPDLDILVMNYLHSDNEIKKVSDLNSHFYSLPTTGQGNPLTLKEKFLNYFMRPHQWLYNFKYLTKMLIETGFQEKSISRCEFQQGNTPDIINIDAHEEESFFLEATK